MTTRRGFLTTCIATCTAPMIVRASSLMALSVPKVIIVPANAGSLTIDMITREALSLLEENALIMTDFRNKVFGAHHWKNDTLIIRRPQSMRIA